MGISITTFHFCLKVHKDEVMYSSRSPHTHTFFERDTSKTPPPPQWMPVATGYIKPYIYI